MEEAKTNQTSTPTGNDDNTWFFEVIIAFLRSPRWRAPVMSFLDEHCIIFDNEEENKLEFTQIHKEFKEMVEKLLGELMQELGVTEEHFYGACEAAKDNPLHKKIVAQITAVDSFMAFKKLMVKRNSDLNSQVLQMMNKQNNPEAAALQEEEMKTQAQKEEEEMIKRALEASQQQEQAKSQEQLAEEEMMKKVMELSIKEQAVNAQPSGNPEQDAMQKQLLELQQREQQIAAKERETAALEAELEKKKRLDEAMEMARQQALKEQVSDRLAQEARQQKQKEQEQKQEEEQKKQQEDEQEKLRIAKMREEDDKIRAKLAQQKAEKEILKKQQQEEAKKLSDQIKEQSALSSNQLPPVNSGSLPSIGARKGQFDLDKDYLKKVQGELDMLADGSAQKPFPKQDDNSGKSMAQLAKERRQLTEAALAASQKSNQPKQESVEDRATRLKAQRDLLRKQKTDKREKELQEFNEKTPNKQDLYSELKKLDSQIKIKAENGSQSQQNQLSAEEMEKRRGVMKKARADLARDEAAAKESQQETQSKPSSNADDPFGDIKSFSVK